MKIAINIWLLRKKELEGIGEFIKETMGRIIADHPDVTFLLMCDKKFTEDYFDFPNIQKYPIFPALRHPVLYVLYMELVVPLFLKKHRPDLLICPDAILSLMTSCRQLACIHDLNFLHQPENLNFRNRVYYTFFTKKFVRKATRIATVSGFSKQDIVTSYNTDPGKIDVIFSGIKPKLTSLPAAQRLLAREQFASGKDYFFFVGSLHPRKNIIRLMQAFDLFKQQTGTDMKLVLAGSIMWDDKDIKACGNTLQHKDDIIFTGRVSDEDLNRLYCGAMAVTFVPLFEGFGLPIVEAFTAQVPLICSNVTSLPEIAGDAAILVDPYDINDIKNAMITVCDNRDGIREQLVERGTERGKLFSWQRTADLLWESVLKIK